MNSVEQPMFEIEILKGEIESFTTQLDDLKECLRSWLLDR